MNLHRSTTILLNVALILVIVLLLKSLIVAPRDVHAQNIPEYSGVDNLNFMGALEFAKGCNKLAKEGWKLHSFNNYKAIFVR